MSLSQLLVDYSKAHKMIARHSLQAPIVHRHKISEDEEHAEGVAAPHDSLTRTRSYISAVGSAGSVGSDEDEGGWDGVVEDRWDVDGEDGDDGRPRFERRRSSSGSSVLQWHEGYIFSPASTSPIPSLSPTRPSRLFEDDSDDDDEELLIELLHTPHSTSSSLSKSPSLSRRPSSRKPTTSDPLLSPPSSSPVLAHAFGKRAGWLPATSNQPRRLSASSQGDLAPPTTSQPQPSISLLTKSLRSLARLPNLALDERSATATTTPVIPPTALDLEGLGAAVEENPWEWRAGVADRMPVDEAWEVPLRPRREGAELGRGRAASVDDHEHETVRVQLQTFSSPPAPPSPPRTTIDLPPLTPVPVVAEQEVEPPLPPTTRYISNPRHLLMISLELAMMRADKIRSPLRPRAVVCRCGGSRGAQMPGSGLRWEVRVV